MKSLIIHQTLHGYAEGHRLLGGSVKLGDELARVMLRMSDLSGSSVVSGFEDYLTGYPLESANMYAFAKTWYASEMPRPGCVWTHTLLIPQSSMAAIPDLQALISFFTRPQGLNSGRSLDDRFFKPIELDLLETSTEASSSVDEVTDKISYLIESLYVQNKDHILISPQNSGVYEVALMRVWSQQWPQVRSSFTFCTGTLSARGFGGKPFDVQCTPPSLVREITSATLAKLSQEFGFLAINDKQKPAWFAHAVDDASKPRGGNFRRLLWEFADDQDWKSFAHFAWIIEAVSETPQPKTDNILAKVAELFPNTSEGRSIKAVLFGVRQDISGFKRLDEVDILLALASTPHFSAYSPEDLQLKTRGIKLCLNNPEATKIVIAILFRSHINPLGEEILAGIIEAINPSLARIVTLDQPQFLATLFRAKPDLGISPELWSVAGDHKRDLLESLILNKTLGAESIAGIIRALLESDSEILLRPALEAWGGLAVSGIFNCLAEGIGNLSERSTNALTFHVVDITKWLINNTNCPDRIVIIAAHIVAPYSYQLKELDTAVWLRTFRELVNSGDSRETNFFAAFLLALGLQNAPPDALYLIEICFEHIHRIASVGGIYDDAWMILEPIIPHLLWRNDWDKCERLRRGLITSFVKYQWPTWRLTDSVKSEDLLSRVVDSAMKVDGGREFILK